MVGQPLDFLDEDDVIDFFDFLDCEGILAVRKRFSMYFKRNIDLSLVFRKGIDDEKIMTAVGVDCE